MDKASIANAHNGIGNIYVKQCDYSYALKRTFYSTKNKRRNKRFKRNYYFAY
jgi:hypothetical protein